MLEEAQLINPLARTRMKCEEQGVKMKRRVMTVACRHSHEHTADEPVVIVLLTRKLVVYL